jgi:hypothetical protein
MMKRIILLLLLPLTMLMATEFIITKNGLSIASDTPPPASYTLPPATYWVDGVNGRDSNDGRSEATAWKTITKAANTLTAGQTVYIKGGTYYERIIPKNSGTEGSYITYAANPGDTVIIDDQGNTPEWEGTVDCNKKAYLNFYGLKVINSGFYAFFIWQGSHHFTIEDCATDNSIASGIYIYGYGGDFCHDYVIRNNTVTYANQGTNADYGYGRYFSSQEAISAHRTYSFIIEDNEVSHGNKEPIDAKGGSYDGVIKNNYIHDFPDKTPDRLAAGEDLYPGAMGIYIDGGSHIEISNNRIERTAGGIHLAHEGGGDITDIYIHHNTVFGGAVKGPDASEHAPNIIAFIEYGGSGKKSNITIEHNSGISTTPFISNATGSNIINLKIKNNIFYGMPTNAAVVFNKGIPTDMEMTNNLIYNDNGRSSTYGSNRINADPQFVDAANGDLHIMSSYNVGAYN